MQHLRSLLPIKAMKNIKGEYDGGVRHRGNQTGTPRVPEGKAPLWLIGLAQFSACAGWGAQIDDDYARRQFSINCSGPHDDGACKAEVSSEKTSADTREENSACATEP